MKKLQTYERISELLYKEMIKGLDEEEQKELEEWMSGNPERRKIVAQLGNDAFLSKEYRLMKSVDTRSAIHQMKGKIERDASNAESIPLTSHLSYLTSMSFLRYAAAILIFIIGGAAWWYADYTKVTPPEIPEAVQLAMQQSKESGKMEAKVEDIRGERNESEVRSEKIRGERNASSAENISLTSHPSPLTSDISAEDILSARRITTYHDKEYWVTLDDGTLVHLNYNTRLIYPEKFGHRNRTVILDGEAYFMVAKDKSRPFIVHTPNGDVKVYGTEFNVNTRTEVRSEKFRGERNASSAENISLTSHLSPLTSVVLVNGSVSVTPTGGKEQLLKPGQQAIYDVQSSKFKVQNVDVQSHIAWNTGRFVFENIEMDHLIDVLARWYGKRVKFEDEASRHIHFTGTFDRYGKLLPMLEAIETVTDVRISLHQDAIVIKKK